MAQLKIEAINKSFDQSSKVLDYINVMAQKGEFLVILGPSGCGKTTLLRIIAGLEKPDSGKIYIAEKDVTETEPKDRDVAMVFQNYALYPHMSVFENLAFALKVRKLSKSEIDTKVKSTAQLLGLTAYLRRRPRQLSGGQRQRVALGRAIVRNPSLFLFDEPLSNLDAELRSQMRFELLSLHRKIGATSIYVTHDQIEAMSLADNIVILNQGRQIGPAKPRELYDSPPDTFVAGFLGNPGMNLLEAFTDCTGRMLKIGDAPEFACEMDLPANSKFIFGFRPENCTLETHGQIPVEVIGAEDTGKEFIVELKGPDNSRIFCLSKSKRSRGDKLWLKINQVRYFNDSGQAIK
jgi:sn-glycerol 3-phosphate transport system ATP-binding protein